MINLLNLLNEKEIKLVKTIKVSKGKLLFSEDENCEYIGIVNEGSLKISSVTINGNEIIYNTLRNGDVFGNNLIFSSSPKFRGDVIALTDSEISLIKKNDLLYILKNNEKLLMSYLEIQSNFGKKLNLQIKLLSLDSAYERFMYYLSINNNEIKYNSIIELSKRLYLQRETLSRLISRLVKEKIIFKDDKKIYML